MNESDMEDIIDDFLDHVRYLRVRHHVPGRIRVKASLNGAKKLVSVGSAAIEETITAIPGIEDYRINKKALSVIIDYNPEVLPFELWEDIDKLGEYPLYRKQIKQQLLDIIDNNQVNS
jgi:hypothetical protein